MCLCGVTGRELVELGRPHMCEPNQRLVEYFVSCGVPPTANRLEALPGKITSRVSVETSPLNSLTIGCEGTDDAELAPIRRRYRSAIVCCFPDVVQSGRAALDNDAVCTVSLIHFRHLWDCSCPNVK